MSEVSINVTLLLDTLKKKEQLLSEIEKYTMEQAKLLAQPELDLRAFNNLMSNKQVRIELLNKIDDGFKVTFDRVKHVLTAQPDLYREAIIEMKRLIQVVNDLGINIRVQEQRNKQNFEAKSKNVKGEVKTYRNHKAAVAKYQNNYAKMKKADEPHFFDSKK